MFNIDFKKLALWLVPVWLRKPTIVLLVMAVTWPLRQVYNSFLLFTEAKLYRLRHNGQVCYLEALLNDAFDGATRRIYISDFDGKQRIYFWPEAERRDVNFGITQYFWPESDYADSGVDFTIHIPADVATSSSQMAYLRSLADEYKLAGKNYNTVRIS